MENRITSAAQQENLRKTGTQPDHSENEEGLTSKTDGKKAGSPLAGFGLLSFGALGAGLLAFDSKVNSEVRVIESRCDHMVTFARNALSADMDNEVTGLDPILSDGALELSFLISAQSRQFVRSLEESQELRNDFLAELEGLNQACQSTMKELDPYDLSYSEFQQIRRLRHSTEQVSNILENDSKNEVALRGEIADLYMEVEWAQSHLDYNFFDAVKYVPRLIPNTLHRLNGSMDAE